MSSLKIRKFCPSTMRKIASIKNSSRHTILCTHMRRLMRMLLRKGLWTSSDGLWNEKTSEVNERVKFSSIQSKAAVKTHFYNTHNTFSGGPEKVAIDLWEMKTARALNKHLTELQDELISVSFIHLFLELEELPVLNKSRKQRKSCEMIRCETSSDHSRNTCR